MVVYDATYFSKTNLNFIEPKPVFIMNKVSVNSP